jgi:SAM-dependent methyltransferase
MDASTSSSRTVAPGAPGAPGTAGADDGREAWAGAAQAWLQRAELIDARHEVASVALLASIGLGAGERVLDLASGAGGLGLLAAARVGSTGTVVISDFAPEMVAGARTRVDELGLSNVTTAVIDLEHIDQPDAWFDVVLCRDGLQFARRPALAIAEMRRVVRSRGRVALAVWAEQARNPWLGVVLDAVSGVLGFEVPPPGVPGPFSLASAHGLVELLEEGGLVDVRVSETAVPLRAPSFEAWWSTTTSLAGPRARILTSLPAEVRDAIRDQARRAAEPYRSDDALLFPGVALLATAVAP